jgi:uncharacterized protein YeaO (DUF488 family)
MTLKALRARWPSKTRPLARGLCGMLVVVSQRKNPRIHLKRAYDEPSPSDGRRVLVERLWPRGMKKEALVHDAWLKDVAPSTELRKWFGHRLERWEEFVARYRAELDENESAWRPLLDDARQGPVTLLYSARDEAHNSALVLRAYLEERLAR